MSTIILCNVQKRCHATDYIKHAPTNDK